MSYAELVPFIIFFMVLCGIAMFCYVYFPNNKKNYEKLLVSIIIILISLAANSPMAYIATIIIVGLLIGSERFMAFLVAILRGNNEFLNSSNFPQIIQAMSTSTQEIKEKAQEELKEIESIDIKTRGNGKKEIGPSTKITLSKLKEIQQKAIRKFLISASLSDNLVYENAKLDNIYADAIAMHEKSHRLYFLEVKLISTSPYNSKGWINKDVENLLEGSVLKLREKIETIKDINIKQSKIILICVVDTDEELNLLQVYANKMKNKHNTSNRAAIGFHFYNLNRL